MGNGSRGNQQAHLSALHAVCYSDGLDSQLETLNTSGKISAWIKAHQKIPEKYQTEEKEKGDCQAKHVYFVGRESHFKSQLHRPISSSHPQLIIRTIECSMIETRS